MLVPGRPAIAATWGRSRALQTAAEFALTGGLLALSRSNFIPTLDAGPRERDAYRQRAKN
jgi:hypothetical protein